MLEQIKYFIFLKTQINCVQCQEGRSFDDIHDCRSVSPAHHQRWKLLVHFNSALFSVFETLQNVGIVEDVQGYILTRLLQAGYSMQEIQYVNTSYNIINTAVKDVTVLWLFDQLWINREDQIPNFQAVSSHPSTTNSEVASTTTDDIKEELDIKEEQGFGHGMP